MFGREMRMLLRHYLEQGTSKSALSRKLGVSRDMIGGFARVVRSRLGHQKIASAMACSLLGQDEARATGIPA
jgi:hypothetical protein